MPLTEVINVKDFGATGYGIADDTTAIQNAINAAQGRIVFVPNGVYKVTGEIKLKAESTLIGESRTKTIIRNDTTSHNIITLGDTTIQGGDADFVTLRNLCILGNSNTSSLVFIPGDVDNAPGWKNPSRFFSIEDLLLGSATGGVAVRISSHSGSIRRIKIWSCARGIQMGNQVNGVLFDEVNISGCTEYQILTLTGLTESPLNVKFSSCILQGFAGDNTRAPILIQQCQGMLFEHVYFEQNRSGKDVVVAADADNVAFHRSMSTGAYDPEHVVFKVAGDGFSLKDHYQLGQAKYVVRFSGNTVKGASINNVLLADKKQSAQAIFHDATSNGNLRLENQAENLLLNPSFIVAQAGSDFSNPSNGEYVLDLYQIEKANGKGKAPTINVVRSSKAPNAYYPYSMGLEITDIGVPHKDRRWKVKQKLDQAPNYQGQAVCFSIMMRASKPMTFTRAQLQIFDHNGTTIVNNITRPIESLSETWETFFMLTEVAIDAQTLWIQFSLDAGGGEISAPGSIYLCAPMATLGVHQPQYFTRPMDLEEKLVKYYYERIDVSGKRFAIGAATQNDLVEVVVPFQPKRTIPKVTINKIKNFIVREVGNNRPVTAHGINDTMIDRVAFDLTTKVTQGNAVRVSGGDNGYIDVDAR